MNLIKDMKERLKNIRTTDQELAKLKEYKEQLKSELTSIGATTWSDMKVDGGVRSTPEDRYIEYIDLSEELEELMLELHKEKNQLIHDIHNLKKGTYRKVLIELYINCKKYREVSESMNYGIRHIYRLEEKAIEALINGD